MTNLTSLAKKAINAAKSQQWQQAADYNQQILDIYPKDLDALNRLALAFMQLDQSKKAKTTLNKVLEIDKHNKIAQKNLDKIKKNLKSKVSFNQESFIEEPGKAKNIELIRVTDNDNLDQINVGQKCELDPKSTYISINTADGDYLGTLPKDISERLIGLIETGNQYNCSIQCCEPEKCVVHLSEAKVSDQNQGVNSFSLKQSDQNEIQTNIKDIHQIDQPPLEMVETDTDVETSEIDVSKIPQEAN